MPLEPGPNGRRRRQVAHRDFGQSKTKQDQADSTDINKIVGRYKQTGTVTHVNQKQPQYGDFTLATDLQTMMETVASATDAFGDLPVRIRAYCDHDPVRLLELLADPAEEQNLIDLGLRQPEREETPSPGPEAPTPAPAAPTEAPVAPETPSE